MARRPPGLLALCCALLVGLGAGPAAGWKAMRSANGAEVRWPGRALVVVIDSLPGPVDDERGRAAVRRAAETWSEAGCDLQLAVATGEKMATRRVRAGTVITLATAAPGEWPHSDTLAAHTDVDSGDARGEVRSATVLLNAAPRGGVAFDAADPVAPGRLDLETVALHELGHALGLAHSYDKRAVMAAGARPGERQRTLTDDDAEGLCALFGRRR